MLGIYEVKHLVGENENDYHLSAQKIHILWESYFLTYHMKEIQPKQKYSCFEWKNLLSKHLKNSESFQLDSNTFLFFIIKLCFKKD